MMEQVRRIEDLKIGEGYTYIGKGVYYRDRDGSHVVSKGAEYDAWIIQITEHVICMRVRVNQSSLHRMYGQTNYPYNMAISTRDFKNGIEKIYREVYR